jgi:hypothetical protein
MIGQRKLNSQFQKPQVTVSAPAPVPAIDGDRCAAVADVEPVVFNFTPDNRTVGVYDETKWTPPPLEMTDLYVKPETKTEPAGTGKTKRKNMPWPISKL